MKDFLGKLIWPYQRRSGRSVAVELSLRVLRNNPPLLLDQLHIFILVFPYDMSPKCFDASGVVGSGEVRVKMRYFARICVDPVKTWSKVCTDPCEVCVESDQFRADPRRIHGGV